MSDASLSTGASPAYVTQGALSIVREASCQRHENRDAEGVEEVGSGEGVSPSPVGEGSWEGAVPPPQKFFYFFHSK